MSDEGNTAGQSPPRAWWRRTDAELAQAYRDRELCIRRAQAEQAQVLAEMHSRGTQSSYGYVDLITLQKDLVRVSRAEAKRRAARARACNPYTEGTATVEPTAPATAAAWVDGVIGIEHVDAVTKTMGALPKRVTPEDREAYEKTLADLARESHPNQVVQAGRHLLAVIDQDGSEPEDDVELAEPWREFHATWDRHNTYRFAGRLDAETGHVLQRLLSPLAKPRPADAGEPDIRSVAQRQGDAFAELVEHAQRAAKFPVEAGAAPTVVVTMTLDQLLRNDAPGHSVPMLDWISPITAEQARRMACDAELVPAVLGGQGEVLDLGRSARTATKAQRRALALRDRGCVFPGCTRPVEWTQVHHIDEWLKNHGRTDIRNLCLLCSAHHRLIHHSGWEIRTATDGLPECSPPAWIDPRRRPQRNHSHHIV